VASTQTSTIKQKLTKMNFDIQSILENDKIALFPLLEKDFEDLYEIGSDPKIWEQHPNKDRWKKEVFKTFFEGAIKSGGAFKIIDKRNGKVIGSTRFYDYNKQENSILIGYTFYSIQSWGKGINNSVKTIMLNYAFQFVSRVYFHVGEDNIRSQIAISRLKARKIGEQEVTYFGEQPKQNYVYELNKNEWFSNEKPNNL
jgi:RimJ/RimL family protein N-acetyltransferase